MHTTNLPRHRLIFAALAFIAILAPQAAWSRDSLGMYGEWGAFRDPGVPRCYAIAMADPSPFERERQPFVAVGSWPRRSERNEVHLRLSRTLAQNAKPVLTIGSQRFALLAGRTDAWSADKRMDAAIVAALRSAQTMRVRAPDARGRSFTDGYTLAGAATAIDAATVACARD